MKFGRFERAGHSEPFWGSVDLESGTVRVIEEPFAEWAPKFSEWGEDRLLFAASELPLSQIRVLAPYEAPARIFCCGANYWEHLQATGLFEKPPEVPVAYFKADASIIGPDIEIRYPSYTNKLDYEVELVAVVGRPLVDGVPPSRSLLGYSIGNDVSVRDTQDPFGTPDLYTMKAADRISPLGPWIVSPDELGGVGQPSLDISLTVNGELRQHDNTGNVIFSIDYSLSWINERNLLRPGDLLYTGTPAGPVGEKKGQPPERFLQPGDVVEARIEGLGVLRNVVGAKESPRGNSWPVHEPQK
jgi:2-keto-4-pentenoate hydratase/2-oxohepta-3-ene-1,7-dioic acid hydratase in catechol pathway